MTFKIRKICIKLHLYLGLMSGIVVFIVCVTGCLYVFKDEIINLSQQWKTVEVQNTPTLLPSELLTIANKEASGINPSAITYGRPSDAVFVDYYDFEKGMTTVYINQYTGQVIKTIIKQKGEFDFFGFMLNGHRHLWLPQDIGKPIVGISVLIFAIILITGLIIWWPKQWNKKVVKRNFIVKRKNVLWGLHSVLGSYSFIILLLLALTGLIWSFDWFSKSVYKLSGGGELKLYTLPLSDTTQIKEIKAENSTLDKLYLELLNEIPNAADYYFALPSANDGVIRVSIAYIKGAYYKTDNLFFDQYTLKPLHGTGPYAGKYADASSADKLRRMNYDIHSGRIWGIWGKIIMFLVSAIGASLPITGYIIWYKKHLRAKKQS
ncbi:PepSY-associated TM helix domain-containing protein [Dysgonomonas sp.]